MPGNLNMFERSGAEFSGCRKYRYRLWREWDAERPRVLYVMLNPSTADEFQNDPTVERCQRRATNMGFGSFEVVNIFAWRSTDPDVLDDLEDPIGPLNNRAIVEAASHALMVICAWGIKGKLRNRGDRVKFLLQRMGKQLHCLHQTVEGYPSHPLYLPYDLDPIVFAEKSNQVAGDLA